MHTSEHSLREAAEEFLAQHTIGVAGVSHDTKQPANLIYRRLRDHGYAVYPINPTAAVAEGDQCYPDVATVPAKLDGVVIVTPASASRQVVAGCAEAGVKRVWLHRGLGPGSVSEDAIALAREHGMNVIPGGCPNMFGPTSDPGHVCMRCMLQATGKVPTTV
jgi:predicted CoA-binding protein